MECEIDDMNPQIFGALMDRLYAAGALDVFYPPVQMKKNRPGTLMTVVAGRTQREALTDLVFRETTTIGVPLSGDVAGVPGSRDGGGGHAARRGALQGGAAGRASAERAAGVRRSGAAGRASTACRSKKSTPSGRTNAWLNRSGYTI